jgi:hypothetical protein
MILSAVPNQISDWGGCWIKEAGGLMEIRGVEFSHSEVLFLLIFFDVAENPSNR